MINSLFVHNKVLLVALVALSSAVFLTPTVEAAESAASTESTILLSPTKKRYDLSQGETKKDSLKVVNAGVTPISFIVYARPYSVINENYDPNYDSASKNADAYKWVQFDSGSYTLEAGKSIDIPYTLRVPQNAGPGGHYGVLFVETQVTDKPTGTAIAQKKRLGAIVYATVKGETTLSGRFVDSEVPFFQFEAPLKIRQRVENKGNTDFVVKNSAKVSDIFGGVKFKYEKEAVVLPDTTRSIDNSWVNPAWIGLYKVEQNAAFLDTSKTSSGYALFIPVWVYLVTVLLIGARIVYALANKKRKK